MLLARIFQAIFIVSLIGIVLVLFQAGATSAGQVIFTQDYRAPGAVEALTFSKPETLKVFQASLQPGRPDYYVFHGDKDAILKVKLDTLRLVGQDNFAPSLAFFGPGLPLPGPEETKLFPFSLPPGNGLLVSAETSVPISATGQPPTLPTRFDEAWTQAGYWERQSILNQLPESGTYYLAVFSLNQQSGKYALFVGDKPEAGLRETLTFPVTWARTHYWFEDLWWPTFALVVVALVLLALVYAYARLVWRQYRRVSFASQNDRRAALLKKKTRHAWQKRRINRKPALEPPSSNVIVARLLTQTASRTANGTGQPKPAAQSAIQPAAPVLEQASFNWENLSQPATVPADTLAATNGKTDQPGRNGESNTSKNDGLSQWGQRFRPRNDNESKPLG